MTLPELPELPAPMRRALELAWASCAAGSFGIGAVATTGAGVVLAEGRNRLLEADPADDVLAGTSLAHAELNVLAKLPYRRHERDDVQLWTTLQPCVQCLGAIRLSSVRRVHVLAPDPLFRGIERMVEVNEFLAGNWPQIDELDVTTWSVFALLLPTHLGAFWNAHHPTWLRRVPRLCALAGELVESGELLALAEAEAPLDGVVEALRERLGACVDEVEALAALGS